MLGAFKVQWDDLIEQMVLLPPASSPSDWAESTKSVNLVLL